MANVQLKSSCISISETWLQNSFYNCGIPGYNFVHSSCLNKVGGSVGIYVTRELELKMRDDLSLKGENCAFLDVMFSRSFVPLITRPTRLTSHTATLIDNIFTNNFYDVAKSGLLVTDISDQLPMVSLVHSAQSKTLPNLTVDLEPEVPSFNDSLT